MEQELLQVLYGEAQAHLGLFGAPLLVAFELPAGTNLKLLRYASS